ncbi:MAG: carboxy terminal-processing peptidase [Verrucomicrobiota bacterium]
MKNTTRSLAAGILLAIFLNFPSACFAEATATAGEGLKPTTQDGRVAYLVARLLERFHYTHHPFDQTVSSEFLDRYLDTLDPQHLYFLQGDLAQFERYRTNLDHLTLTDSALADTTPAFEIFDRFVERLKQRFAYSDELLKQGDFKFDTDEKILISRKDAPYPDNLEDARKLWKERLRYEYLQEKLALEQPGKKAAGTNVLTPEKIHQQIVDTLTHRYQRILRVYTDWNDEDVLGLYLTALAHVYDPHSDYFNREAMGNFEMSMNLQLFGIGAELRSEDGYCKIARLLPGPAAKSGEVKEGDRIIAVGQSNSPPVDIVDMSLSKAVQLIRGPKGTQVRLTIIPAGDPTARRVVSLIRDEIPLEDQAAKGRIFDFTNSAGQRVRIGFIDLPSFYAPLELTGLKRSPLEIEPGHSTSADVARLLNKFKEENVNGVILDLRRNGGGSLEEAVKLTGLFIKDGPVVQVKSSDGSVSVDEDMDPSVTWEGPLLVMTSRISASASEIVAGALQDYGRAILVGDSSTHGKGTVQNLNPLQPYLSRIAPLLRSSAGTNNPGALKVTIRKFYRASGASTQLKGVMPDIVLPSVLNYWKDLGESSLENPLPWDTIPGADYEKLDLVRPYLPELLKRSSERVATNQDFAYIREDIDQYRKLEADKMISLNEQQRLKEMREMEGRDKARNQERQSRKPSGETVYEITLKQALLPGLPAPVQKTNGIARGRTGSESVTNSVAATVPSTGDAEPADDVEGLPGLDAKAAAVDADLEESKRILSDYLLLLPKDSPLLATGRAGH